MQVNEGDPSDDSPDESLPDLWPLSSHSASPACSESIAHRVHQFLCRGGRVGGARFPVHWEAKAKR